MDVLKSALFLIEVVATHLLLVELFVVFSSWISYLIRLGSRNSKEAVGEMVTTHQVDVPQCPTWKMQIHKGQSK